MPAESVTVTYLEMRSPSVLRPKRCDDPSFRVEEATIKQWQFNRFVYELVGSDWHWTDKSRWSEQQWRAYAEADDLRTFAAYCRGSLAGYYELRSEPDGGVEIAILGLAPKFVGKGLGGALVTDALQRAWSLPANRVWLHTCSLDHPAALPNYLARGMTVFRTAPAGK